MSNRLAAETSPYLRQHADNPVEWYPWGTEAFGRARAEDRPVFLSVGYSACHWCHVMAHESFEDPATASLMNERFVNVKVDREERPDVDAVYMEAVQALTGRGGWPMSVFLLPDGRPFFGGTYFPPADRHGMPGFSRVLDAIHEAWEHQRDDVEAQAAQLHQGLQRSVLDQARSAGGGELDADVLATATRAAIEGFDPRWGGFGGAPKFPPGSTLAFLARREVVAPDPDVRTALTTTLDAMAAGGIHDHLGGGFARYSVDERWLVPHFEKMLYDQALLLRAYLAAHLLTGEPRYRAVVEGIVTYVERDLSVGDGGYASAEDADSEGEEGRFYVWDRAEIDAVCGADADEVARFFGVTDAGNFEGRTILHRVDRTAPVPPAVARCIPALLAHRSQRVRPGLDDKVLTEWNALYLRALAEAADALDRPDWMDAARRGARFLLDHLRRDDGRLLRSWQSGAPELPGTGRARHLAYAADHAALLEALCTLAEVDGPGWLAPARAVADELLARFHDGEGGGFHTTGDDAEPLVVRPKDVLDHATPSANSMAANGLLRLAALTGERAYEAPAEGILAALAPLVARHPTSFAHLLEAVERHVAPPLELAVVGRPDDPATAELRRAVAGRLLPVHVRLVAAPGDDAATPLLEGRTAPGPARAYVCEGYACRTPAADAATLREQLDAAIDARRANS